MYLRTLRQRLHLTQVQLAARTHGKVPQTVISRLERNGRARPQMVTVVALARALGVPAESLRFGLPPAPRPRTPRPSPPVPREVQP